MAALDRRYARLSLLCASVSALPLPLIAADHPYQEWVCRPAGERWECRRQDATSGAYPQPPQPAGTPGPAPGQSTADRDPKSPTTPATAAARDWDWVPVAELTPAQRCDLEPGCDGAYVEPPRDWPEADQPRQNAPLRASAGSSRWQGDTVILEDGIELTKGELKVLAEHGELDRAADRAILDGDVRVREPGLLLTGSHAELNTATGLGELQQARILHYDSGARAEAERLSRPSEELAVLEQASYTQCRPGAEVWRLSAGNLRLDRASGRGEARDTVLRLGPVPVFYTPYMNFPIDDRRQSGWLWPSLSSSDGGDIAAPYYLNLAPNYDATLTPRYIGDRGAMLETELRHLAGFGQTELGGAYLPDDDLTGGDRWLFSGEHRGRLGSHVGTLVDYTKVSDIDYFRDLSVSSLDIKRQTHLNQRAQLSSSLGQWRTTLLVQQYQTIDEFVAEPYQRLPQWTLRREGGQRNFRPDYTFLAEYTDFDHDESIAEGGNRITGQRLYSEAGLTLPMHWAAGYIQPTLKMRYVGYELDDLPGGGSSIDDENPSSATPMAIVDAGLFFERETEWFGDGYLQTLEPRLYYLWSEHEQQSDQPLFDTSRLTFSYQQLFRPFRFSGYDRLEDFDQLSLGVTSRWIGRGDGRELITASVGQIFYFDEREVTSRATPRGLLLEETRRDNSELAAELRLQPNDSFWATASTLWDTTDDRINEGGFYLHYSGEASIFNLGYRYRRAQPGINHLQRNLEQADASAVLPVSERWSLFARFNYDLEDNRSLEDLFGVQYEDCCWLARVVYQRAVEGEDRLVTGERRVARDHAIIFEFQLKGLGSLGSKADGLLDESILGYGERD